MERSGEQRPGQTGRTTALGEHDTAQDGCAEGEHGKAPVTLTAAGLRNQEFRRGPVRAASAFGSDRCHAIRLRSVSTIGDIVTSIMLGVKVNRSDPALLHDQVAADLRRAIAQGEAKPGERLPPARDLAAILGVNINTVLRALRQLRDEGLLEFRRGRGIHVAGGAAPKSVVFAKAQDLIQTARQQGYRKDDLLKMIDDLA